MSYVDALYDRHTDTMRIVERVNGERIFKEDRVEHVFYYEHPAGTHKSIFGDACKRFAMYDGRKFRGEVAKKRKAGLKLFEPDIRPEFRYLADHYAGADAPVLNVGFFDIEAAFDADRGFAPTDDPFNAVTAITVHLSHLNRAFTLALCPPTLSIDEAEKIASRFEDTIVFEDEADMLNGFLHLIEDVDVLTGWNSEGYDIPYLVNRVKRLLSNEDAKRFCLWDQFPRTREYLKFGKTFNTYDLVGRVHLDYLLLYQKHNPQQLHSYRLDYVAEIEVGDNKVPYTGTLDDLYKKDFDKFIDYNRQDVALMVKIDEKKKFIELANQIAHANCVLLKTTMGSVALVEQAIINEMHALGYVVPERKQEEKPDRFRFKAQFEDDDDEPEEEDDERTPVVGAYVAKPKTGIHHEIACVDINSLYPSCIRALNMSPETIVGQIRSDETMALIQQRIADGVPRAEAWEGIFCTLEVSHMMEQDDALLTIDYEDGTTVAMTGAQLYGMVFAPQSGLCVTANGTIFRTDTDGIIPQLLAKWYSDRKTMQAKEAAYQKMVIGVPVDDELAALLAV